MSRFIQYIGNKPTKRDNILRTHREWERGSVCECSDDEAREYLKHPDIFRDVTHKLDKDGNPPPLPPLKTAQAEKPSPAAVDDPKTAKALKDKVAVLEAELGKAHESIETLRAELDTEREKNAALEKENTELYEKLGSEPESESEESDGQDDDRQQAILNAIGKLDRKNPAHFTEKGVPKTKALEQVLGYPVSSEERDAAWHLILEAAAAG